MTPQHPKGNSSSRRSRFTIKNLFFLLLFTLFLLFITSSALVFYLKTAEILQKIQVVEKEIEALKLQSGGPVLNHSPVMIAYIFANVDPYYLENMLFFLESTILNTEYNNEQHLHYTDYHFIIQSNSYEEYSDIVQLLPLLPRNGRYIRHPNKCFDFGSWGWLLGLGHSNNQTWEDVKDWPVYHPDQTLLIRPLSQYQHFILLNCGIRGPFYPQYFQPRNWYDVFFRQILITQDEDIPTKWFGISTSCEGSPHVQSMLQAFDRTAFEIVAQDSNIWKCWPDMRRVIDNCEFAASGRILSAGYNIGSTSLFFDGLNFARARINESDSISPLSCLSNANPMLTSLLPVKEYFPFEHEYIYTANELVFVKVQEKTQGQIVSDRARESALLQSHIDRIRRKRRLSPKNINMFENLSSWESLFLKGPLFRKKAESLLFDGLYKNGLTF